jgi:hypothetical protein
MLNLKLLEKLKPFDKIELSWLDSVSDRTGWEVLEEYDFDNHREAMNYISSGYFLKVHGDALFMCQSVRLDEGCNHIGGIMSFPIQIITNIRRI